MPGKKVKFISLLLTIIFIGSVLRLAGFVVLFGSTTLQMDFSAFYTAGESLNNNLSPYLNYVNHPKPIWDGINTSIYSRFIYPPLVANFFQLIARIPYQYAKYGWMIINIVCLCASMLISIKLMIPQMSRVVGLCIGIFICFYHPLLTLLERGQIDGITLLLIISGINLLVRGKKGILAGLLFAIATLLKLYCVFILPFLVFRLHWKIIAGYIMGVFLISILSLLVSGKDQTANYLEVVFPRLVNYGQESTVVNDLPPDMRRAILANMDAELNSSIKDGRVYRVGYKFADNATLVRIPALEIVFSKLGEKIGVKGFFSRLSILSLVFLGIFTGIIILWDNLNKFLPREANIFEEFSYWILIITVILLCAPITWVMNTVWLLPATVVFLQAYLRLGIQSNNKRFDPQVYFLLVGILGLLLAAIPDLHSFPLMLPYGWRIFEQKYVIAELFVFVGLLGLLSNERFRKKAEMIEPAI